MTHSAPMCIGHGPSKNLRTARNLVFADVLDVM
jgi:hypothetical protein